MKMVFEAISIIFVLGSSTLSQAQNGKKPENYELKISLLEKTKFDDLKFPALPYTGGPWNTNYFDSDTTGLLNFFTHLENLPKAISDEENFKDTLPLGIPSSFESLLRSHWSIIKYLAVFPEISKIDLEILKSRKARKILSKIEDPEIQKTKDSTAEIQRLLSLEIDKVPTPRERLFLRLKWLQIFIKVDSFYRNVDLISFLTEIRLIKKEYKDEFSQLDKALIYSGLAEFAANYNLMDEGFKFCNLAIFAFNKADNVDSITKLKWQAKLYNLMGSMAQENPENEAQEFASNLFQTSSNLFLKSKDSINAYTELLKTYSVKLYILTIYKLTNGIGSAFITNEGLLNEIIRSIKRRWGEFQGAKQDFSELNFFRNLCVGQILEIKKNHEDALRYFRISFLHGCMSKNAGMILISLVNISSVYSNLKNTHKSLEYADSCILLGSFIANTFDYQSVVYKGFVFVKLSDYKSALAVADYFLKDSTLPYKIYPPEYNYLKFWFINIKEQALAGLRPNSLDQTLVDIYSFRLQFLEDLIHCLNTNSSLLLWSTDYLLSENISIESKKLNISNQISELRTQITVLQRDTLREESARLKILDSLNRAKDTIVIQAKTIASQKSTEVKYTYFIAALIISMLGLFAYFFLKSRKRKFKIEASQLNELARNKIHNFKRDVSEIQAISLNSDDKENLFWFFQRYNKFLALFSRNWENNKLTLHDELEEFNSFIALLALKKDVKIISSISIENTNKVFFLNSIFDTFFHNSIKHGFKDKVDGCVFTYSIRLEKNLILCEISDNGTPAKDAGDYFEGDSHGLSILKRRIQNYFKSHGVKYRDGYFQISSFTDKPGTHIKLFLPYGEA